MKGGGVDGCLGSRGCEVIEREGCERGRRVAGLFADVAGARCVSEKRWVCFPDFWRVTQSGAMVPLWGCWMTSSGSGDPDALAWACSRAFLKPVGDEAAGVGGDEGGVFADADAGGVAADDPGADDGVVAGEGDFGVKLLIDLGLGMPGAVGAFEEAAVLDEADVGAFAAEVGLFHVVAHAVGFEGGAQEVGVAFEHRPLFCGSLTICP